MSAASVISSASLPSLGTEEQVPAPDPLFAQVFTPELFHCAIAAKQHLMEKALQNKWKVYDPVFIGGDLFTAGSFIFNGIVAAKPALKAVSAISWLSLIFGVISGFLNILVGSRSLEEAIKAVQNKDWLNGVRLSFDCVFMTAIGVVMIFVSLSLFAALVTQPWLLAAFFFVIGFEEAIRAAWQNKDWPNVARLLFNFIAMTTIGFIIGFVSLSLFAALATQPWLLPVLFLIVNIPTIYEVIDRNIPIWRKKDLASRVLENIAKKEELGSILRELYQKALDKLGRKNASKEEAIGEIMEIFQADMQVKAAIAAFRLLKVLLEKPKQNQPLDAKEALADFKKEVAAWHRHQRLRLLQQLLFILSFAISMIALSVSKVIAKMIEISQDFALAVGNAIPFYLDWRPFYRNTPLITPNIMTLAQNPYPTKSTAQARAFP